MSLLCSWGQSTDGQLGLGGIDDDRISCPREVTLLSKCNIKDVSCGNKHTVIVSKDGVVYTCGNNDAGQLGHDKSRKKPEQVLSLEACHINQVSAGGNHNLVVNSSGEVYSWGDNSGGQLGHGDIQGDLHRTPRLVKALSGQKVIQVSCGECHSLVLTNDSRVFTWGSNSFGQLGIGKNRSGQKSPQLLDCLKGIPMRMITAGANHSCVLSLSGALFVWGKNSFGQLGVNDQKDRHFPTLCKSLRSLKVMYVACGGDHTAVLSEDGGVFTFGAGMYGQLGHGSQNTEFLPKKVLELMGSIVTQIACGRCHTLAFVLGSGKIYSFGLGGNGQLGLGDTANRSVPSAIKAQFENNSMAGRSADSVVWVEKIFAGGDQCFCQVSWSQPVCPEDFRVLKEDRRILHLSDQIVDRICELSVDDRPPAELSEKCEMLFGSASCLNSSFLMRENKHFRASSKNHGVDLESAKCLLQRLGEMKNKILSHIICGTLESKLLRELPSSPPDVEALRLYLFLPLCHLFDNPRHYRTIICPFGESIIKLDKSASKIIDLWWSSQKAEEINRLVYIYKQVVVYILNLPSPTDQNDVMGRQRCLHTSMEVLKKLNSVNEMNGQIIPYHRFYIAELTEKVNIKADYVNWVQVNSSSNPGLLSFCNYAFVFDAKAKTMLLQTDAVMQMQFAIDEVYRRNISSMLMHLAPVNPLNPCLILCVSRNNLVQDTILQLSKQGAADFKKPLKVLIQGEEAIDAGGVKKEFFLLILREVLDPKYGMFKYHEESRRIWFQKETFEEEGMFHLIGVLCGLAIYNSIIIDIHFPLALYKKILNRPVTLDDLKDLMPSVGRSLQCILDYEGDDFEELFDLTFEVSEDYFGELRSVELSHEGKTRQVTKENRKEYVDAYIDYIFNKSVEKNFRSFNEGFHKVCGGRVLELFHPKELEAMVVGNENYDFHELEKNTEYKDDFHRYHPTIKIFWEVFHDLSLEEKKKFLLFLTGSDRIPILGMKAVKLFIQPAGGGEDFLPVAHTCFNLLDLPRYTSKDRLRQKLLHAIENSQGFGIV
ncbi:probable E3 ubiquitin-protein ligase HERC4 isoform X2 [Liolophura sinensis]|uniref:probable E3 ubiquitin-protein ligase HERC4 isoform X2 n=1 Tax=Liolophura sinensis TaxID=3198878 RepID=UPI0031593F77